MSVVATVAGRPLHRDDVEAVIARMRSGPAGALMPRDDGAEGRQLRRWVVQLATTQALVESWAAEHRVSVTADDERPWRPDPVAALELGSVSAAVLASSPVARAVFRTVTAEVASGPAPALPPPPPPPTPVAVRWLRVDGDVTAARARFDAASQGLGELVPARLAGPLGDAVRRAAAHPGEVVGPVEFAGTSVLVRADAPASRGDRGESPAADARAASQRREFGLWLDRRRRESVVLAPGFEHPGDPRQPDNTHRH